jgi:drug/metabolite transporter (DMT)-like permease
VLALSFAPITIVQPVLSTFQLFLLVLARFELHERIGWREASGVLAVMVGVTVVIVAAPHHTVAHPPAGRVAVPMAVVGAAALVVYAFSRARGPRSHGLWLALGAGLGYAWVDFADKLLSNAIVAALFLSALAWALAVMAFGALAFLEENSALQVRSPVVVGPVIGAIQEPLPVLMALLAGVESWTGGASQVVELVAGLALVALGAATLARSPAVARVSHDNVSTEDDSG